MGSNYTPEIRFQEFSGNWEEGKLKEIANFIRGSFPQPYTNPDWYDEVNGRPFVQVADIGFDLKLNKDTKLHISKIAEPKSRFVDKGKVVVALQGSIEKSIGRVAITQYPAFFDRTILIFESYKVEIDNYYFAQVIQKLFQREKERAWGATISTITKEALSDFVIGLPSINEQKVIGSFLKKLDDTITLQQQELDTLKQTKQGFLQKMFPKEGETVPEIRFPGFSGEWEERKLSEIAEFNPKSILPDEFEYVDLESVVGTNLIAHRTESKESAPSRAQRLAQRGDVFYQTVRPYQKNNYLYDLPYNNYVFSTGYAQMRPIIDSYFLLSRVQEELFVKTVLDRSTGTSYPAINSNDLSEIEIKVPTDNDEQTQIGNFFKQLDETIALQQKELDALKQTKKAFLQKMFI
ncbi:restriction endonuclease subunit S [Cytobacillus sp. FSL R7-0680]|uniref:restriction endonuclease subunit S n=1 Tax=Cytobacillus sp. FSL R7-0680 TaxID=2921689 RepID=UPI0030FB2DC3